MCLSLSSNYGFPPTGLLFFCRAELLEGGGVHSPRLELIGPKRGLVEFNGEGREVITPSFHFWFLAHKYVYMCTISKSVGELLRHRGKCH